MQPSTNIPQTNQPADPNSAAEGNGIAPASPPTTTPPSGKKQRFKNIASTIFLLAAAPLIAILLTVYVFQSYEVEGPSMQETLHDGDRLIVAKLPRTWAEITGNDYIPARGDIIVFNRSGMDAGKITYGDKQLIKRVIGLPGERITVSNGAITIFNSENPDGFNPDKDVEWSDNIVTTSGTIDMIIPDGSVFVCGDNRNNSADSRLFGPVIADDIVGKLALRISPLNQAEVF